MTREQFEKIVNENESYLRSRAMVLTQGRENPISADDLYQDFLLTFWRFKDRYKEQRGTKVRTYCAIMMKNLYINKYRTYKNKRGSGTHFEASDYQDAIASPVSYMETMDQEFLMEELQNILSNMSPEQSINFKILMLHYEGFKYEELAEQFDLPMGTIKSKIFMVKKRLREALLSRDLAA